MKIVFIPLAGDVLGEELRNKGHKKKQKKTRYSERDLSSVKK